MRLALSAALAALSSVNPALAQDATVDSGNGDARAWFLPAAPVNGFRLDAGLGVLPPAALAHSGFADVEGEVGRWVLRGSVDYSSDERLHILGLVACAHRWRSLYSVGVAALALHGVELSDDERGSSGVGGGLYLEIGPVSGLRLAITLGVAATGLETTVERRVVQATAFDLQMPVLVVGRLRFLLAWRQTVAWLRVIELTSSLALTAIIDGRWRVSVGAEWADSPSLLVGWGVSI